MPENPYKSPQTEDEPKPTPMPTNVPYVTESESVGTILVSLLGTYCLLVAPFGLLAGVFVGPSVVLVSILHLIIGLCCISRRRTLIKSKYRR